MNAKSKLAQLLRYYADAIESNELSDDIDRENAIALAKALKFHDVAKTLKASL